MKVKDILHRWLKVVSRATEQEKLDAMWETHACPDCSGKDFYARQDGGHDVVLECKACGMEYGFFEVIRKVERIGRARG